MGPSLTYNSLGSTTPFPVSVLCELLARSRIMSTLPHTLSVLKENWEVVKFWLYYFLINLSISFFFAFLFSANDFPFLEESYLWSCFYSSCSHISLTRVPFVIKWRRDRIYSSSSQMDSGVFCWSVVAVKLKKKF